jgi:hypothetical protein
MDTLNADVAKWDDEVVIARNVARLSLAPEIAKLQEIRRHVEGLSGPTCFNETRDSAVDFMNASIGFFSAFLGQESTVGLADKASAARSRFDSAVARLASSVGVTMRPHPTPTPFRISRQAGALALTLDDVGPGYQPTGGGSACNQTTTDCAISAFATTSLRTGDPISILNMIAVYPTDGDASSFLARVSKRPEGEQVTPLTVGLGDESAGWFFVSKSLGNIDLNVRRANAVTTISLIGVSGPARLSYGLGLAAKQLDRMR